MDLELLSLPPLSSGLFTAYLASPFSERKRGEVSEWGLGRHRELVRVDPAAGFGEEVGGRVDVGAVRRTATVWGDRDVKGWDERKG
ncbi:unnamed protein product [Linum trigynum]|uniref:Uncharacterized protein n=1 Tax=Linum trigynum TaxID=586398 RepID=A0AAV2EUC0_9ROSI